jgi:NAD-dependent deacetylase
MATRTSTDQATRLAEMLREARSAVVLTGAGVSVPSGIPDFRSPGTGIWEKVNPMEVAHIDAFRRDPDQFWHFYSHRFMSLREKQPNPAHEAVAELERRGLIRGVITQNIDRLHRAAGSRNVIEVHGSIDRSVCLECGGYFPLDKVVEQIESDPESAPECSACIAPLKPDVVLFGEFLPEDALTRAHDLAAEADLMIAIGTSLEVHPVAALPGITLQNGGKLAIVTQGPTPYDRDAVAKLDGDVVAELEALLAATGS